MKNWDVSLLFWKAAKSSAVKGVLAGAVCPAAVLPERLPVVVSTDTGTGVLIAANLGVKDTISALGVNEGKVG